MRLAEGLHDAATSDCMAHAETALSVVGGTEEEVLENLHSRGRWQQLSGQHETAVQILTDVYDHREVLSPQGAAEVALHLGLSRAALGGTREAVQLLNDSAAAFFAAGALDRSSHAYRLADRARSGAPVGLNGRTEA